MRFSTVSLFPEIIEASVNCSIAKRAIERGLFEVKHFQIRDHAVNAYGKVDDALYGGGTGMLLMAEPVYQTVIQASRSFAQDNPEASKKKETKEKVIYMSPRGRLLTQDLAGQLLSYSHLILISGHYEGIDERVLEEVAAEEISIGDYVLSGGELASAVLVDVVMRMIPGVLPDDEAWQSESHASGLLEEKQYTRPATWRERRVPEILLSGHAARIEKARELSALDNTMTWRPDLLDNKIISAEDWFALLKTLDIQGECK